MEKSKRHVLPTCTIFDGNLVHIPCNLDGVSAKPREMSKRQPTFHRGRTKTSLPAMLRIYEGIDRVFARDEYYIPSIFRIRDHLAISRNNVKSVSRRVYNLATRRRSIKSCLMCNNKYTGCPVCASVCA